MPTTAPSRGQRHLDQIRREAIHEQQRQALAAAHRRIQNLETTADQLTALGWNRTEAQSKRLGATVSLLAQARDHLADLERQQHTERALGLEPQPPPAAIAPNGSRRGLPPDWWLGAWPPKAAARATQPRGRPTARRPARRPA
jgi:hypothetical protein